jgi:hypothetical protein
MIILEANFEFRDLGETDVIDETAYRARAPRGIAAAAPKSSGD